MNIFDTRKQFNMFNLTKGRYQNTPLSDSDKGFQSPNYPTRVMIYYIILFCQSHFPFSSSKLGM